MQPLRIPPNRESQMSWYLAVQIQIEILVLFEFVPWKLSFTTRWMSGSFAFWEKSVIRTTLGEVSFSRCELGGVTLTAKKIWEVLRTQKKTRRGYAHKKQLVGVLQTKKKVKCKAHDRKLEVVSYKRDLPPKNGEIALWLPTNSLMCSKCVSQKWNERRRIAQKRPIYRDMWLRCYAHNEFFLHLFSRRIYVCGCI